MTSNDNEYPADYEKYLEDTYDPVSGICRMIYDDWKKSQSLAAAAAPFTLLDVVEMTVHADARLRGDDPEIDARCRTMALALEFARTARGAATLHEGRIIEVDMAKALDSLAMLAAGAEQMLTLMYISLATSDRQRQTQLIIARAEEMAQKLLASVNALAGHSREDVQKMIDKAVATQKALDQQSSDAAAKAAQSAARRMN